MKYYQRAFGGCADIGYNIVHVRCVCCMCVCVCLFD